MGAMGVRAQEKPVPAAEGKPLAFEVVSVRENKAEGRPRRMPDMGPTPDGYRSMNSPLLFPLMAAYVPSPGQGTVFTPSQISGLPDWVMQEPYDLTAKVSEADLPEWQKPASQAAMLRAMLQSFFAERCKVVVHREMKESPVFFLVPGKGGPRLKETNPNETHMGLTLPGGGVMMPGEQGWMTYNISLGQLAALLTQMGGGLQPVIDRTGLTGRYDMVLTMRERMGPDVDMLGVIQQELDGFGLKLQSEKAPVERLVVDHMERSSAN